MVKVSGWTEKEEKYLIKWWHKKSNKEIGIDLGKTEQNVNAKANKIITFEMMSGRKWSEYEEMLLQRLYGTIHIEELSKRMKRSKFAIKHQIDLLEGTADACVIQPLFTTSDVSRFLGITKSSVVRRIKKGDIPFYYIDENRMVIHEDKFWKWLKNNLHIPKYKTITDDAELDSPDWYRAIIKQKKQELRYSNKNNPWSSKDEALLRHELMKGTPLKEISAMLGRGYDVVRKRAKMLIKRKSNSQKAS